MGRFRKRPQLLEGEIRDLRKRIIDYELRERRWKRTEQELRRLSSRLVSLHENEKARVAKELHDGFGQTLTAIKFGIENALKQLEADSEDLASKTLSALVPMIQDAVEEIRNVAINLRPTMLDNGGFILTVKRFVHEFKNIHPLVRTIAEISVGEQDVPERLKLPLFRILQEATNNIVKHSSASAVTISLSNRGNILEFVVKDNGRGFDIKRTLAVNKQRVGVGIRSMTERTRESGGVFTIESSIGEGTAIRAAWSRQSSPFSRRRDVPGSAR